MRSFSFLLIGLLLLSADTVAQKKTANLYRGFVKYGGSSALGTLNLVSTGFGKKRAESISDAYYAAFYSILFRGIPGSQYELPLVGDESEKKGDPAVRKLLEKEYMSFVTDSRIIDEDKKAKREDGAKGISTTHNITVNYDALRRHLEDNKVIRKFGI